MAIYHLPDKKKKIWNISIYVYISIIEFRSRGIGFHRRCLTLTLINKILDLSFSSLLRSGDEAL